MSAKPEPWSGDVDQVIALVERTRWKVFPTREKRPLTVHGFKDASNNAAQITAWGGQFPGCAWAAATGASMGGPTVLDIDLQNGGDQTLDELLQRYGEPLPNTLTARSGGGGTHFFFDAVPGLRSSAGRIGPGIDIKSEGGSITLPPSLHKSGERYRWLNDARPTECPKWIRIAADRAPTKAEEREAQKRAEEARARFERVGVDDRVKQYAAAAFDCGMVAIRSAREGKRRDTLNAEAFSLFQLVGAGVLERGMVADGATAAGLATGLSAAEVAATIKGAMYDGIHAPRYPPIEERAPLRVNGHAKIAGHNNRSEPLAADPDDPATYVDVCETIGREGGAPRPILGGRPRTLRARALAISRIADIPPRPWAFGRFLLFGSAAMIAAVGGTGKGTLSVAIALSFITGRDLLGETAERTGDVVIVAFEDDEFEWRRRIAAACIHHRISFEEVVSHFHFLRFEDGGLPCFAALGQDGKITFPDAIDVIARVRETGAVLLIVDPLNKAHALADGNANVAMARLAQELDRIAAETGVALLIVHHLRKGATGTVDDVMGASSITQSFRACRVLRRMTDDEAPKFGIDPKASWRYVRISGSKENLAPPPDRSVWYRLESVDLENSTAERQSDNVQAVARWNPPSPFADVDLLAIERVLSAIRRGPSAGEFYSPDKRANDRAATVIAKETGKSEEEADRILKAWIESGVLRKERYQSSKRQHEAVGLRVNEEKAAEILRPLRHQDDADDA